MNDKTRKILSRPFDKSLVKTRKGPAGKTLSYVELQAYVDRLNEAFQNSWSHEIVCREQFEDQVLVEVKLTIGEIRKTGIGGSIIHRNGAGKLVSLAADFKIAEAEALKRAARSLGMAAELYKDESTVLDAANANQGNEGGSEDDGPPRQSGRITTAQLSKLEELVRELGSDWRSYRTWVRGERGINVEYAEKRVASELISELLGHLRRRRLNGKGPHNAIGEQL